MYQHNEFEHFCRWIVVGTQNNVQSYFRSAPASLDRQKRIKFFSKPFDAVSNNQAILRHIWSHCPDVGLPLLPNDDAESVVENLVWPFVLNSASQLWPIMTHFLDVQTHLLSEAIDDEKLEHLQKFSSSFQICPDWLWTNFEVNRFGVLEGDGISAYRAVFSTFSHLDWSEPQFMVDRLDFCIHSLEPCCPIMADYSHSPWFFGLGVTWGEFRDRCRQCANTVVDVEGLCEFLRKTRMSWIPLFDPGWSPLQPSATLSVPKKSFLLRQPAQAQEDAGMVAREKEEVEEGARRVEGGGEEDASEKVIGAVGEEEGDGVGGSEAEQSDGQKGEEGTKSGVSFSVMTETSGMAEKASDGAESQHRLEDVFPLTIAGDSVLHAHAPH